MEIGQTYLTLVSQIDVDVRRLIWVGEHRTLQTINAFFTWFGADRIAELRFIRNDMWKPYLRAIGERADHALHVLDCFHIVARMSKASDEVVILRPSTAHDFAAICSKVPGGRSCVVPKPFRR